MAKAFSVKDSVNLPKTPFKMQANLAQNEPSMLRFWEEIGLYNKILEKNNGRTPYILHDGPPYANGNIHLGHALNKILKDFIVKHKTMKGFYSPYIPGWDCHGLPIEKKMEAELGLEAKQMNTLEFRRKCREYAGRYVGIQREQFRRLGGFGSWDRPYLTMNYGYEATTARVLGEFVGKGMVYRGAKPVFWCISCQTALAEAEVEYEDHESPSIYVKFPARSDFSSVVPELAGRKVSVVIWTTTPWTLPANLAIALNPGFDYVALPVGDEVLIVAEGLAGGFCTSCGLEAGAPLATFKGEVLERQICGHPFLDRDSLLVLADYVTLDQGTGCVHTAPGHGQDDYVTGQRYGLPILCPVDNEGRFTDEAGIHHGEKVFEANQAIVELLRSKGALIQVATLGHSYPHCWRCHQPIIFRSTRQWFIAMDRGDLRETAVKEIAKVSWVPAWGEDRITNMVANRPDWCISRQRSWGVPIPALTCRACGETLLSKDVVDRVADVFETEGADAWYQYEASHFLPEGVTCKGCGGRDFDREYDILDVWFDSGVSYEATRREFGGLPYPADMYLEGGDQYRGWFHSSLLAHIGVNGASPYREVLTHGWALDKDGLAMSKSRGNVVEPAEVINQAGAEVLRLWVSSTECTEDVRISDEILARLKEAYRKIRNTMRFMLGNLAGFDPAAHVLPLDQMQELDRWALARAAEVFEKCDRAFSEYTFHTVYHTVYQFCTVDLSSVYFDILKDRLYTAPADSPERRSAQTALWLILHGLVRLLAPVIPFTTEEVWRQLQAMVPGLEESVHLASFPTEQAAWANPELLGRWNRILGMREAVSKALEARRQAGELGNSLEATIILRVGEEDHALLAPFEPELRFVFLVSGASLELAPGREAGDPEVLPAKAEGDKCERCWNYSPSVGSHADFPTVCDRCIGTVRTLAELAPEV